MLTIPFGTTVVITSIVISFVRAVQGTGTRPLQDPWSQEHMVAGNKQKIVVA